MPDLKLSPFLSIQGVGAASGLLLQQDQLYIISDSSAFLYRYACIDKTLHKIALVPAAEDHIEKKYKFDLESLCLKDQALYLFGSGSTPQRHNLFSYDLANQQIDTVDLSALYARFRVIAQLADDELNIEGAVYDDSTGLPRWIFLQRGNGAAAKNGLFVLSGEGLDVQSPILFLPIRLPAIGRVEASFTDGCLHDGKLYFLGAAEDTASTYDDGDVLGSLIGRIDLATLQLEAVQKISGQHKFEGLTVLQATDQSLEFLLCEDNDTDVLESTIYQLAWHS